MQIFGSTTLEELYNEGLISVRSKNACNYVGIQVVSDITEYIQLNGSLYNIPHLGKKSVLEINDVLAKLPKIIQQNQPSSSKVRLVYGIRMAKEVKDILDSENVDKYVADCLLAPIVEIPSVEKLRSEIDYVIQSRWRQAINERLGNDFSIISNYVKNQYFRWNGLDLLHKLCFHQEQILQESEWCTKDEFIVFVRRTIHTFRLFVGWLLKNDFYGNTYFRSSFKEAEYLLSDYLQENDSQSKRSVIEITNEYYHLLIEDNSNIELIKIANIIAPEFYDAIRFCTYTFEDFSKHADVRYKLNDSQKKDLYSLFWSVKNSLIEVLVEDNENIIEGKIVEKKFPFAEKSWIPFMSSYRRIHSHYPMFYLLQQILKESVDNKDCIYREYYGIGCTANPSVTALADKISSTKNTIINYLKRVPKSIQSTNILEFNDWNHYPIIHDSVIEEYSSEINAIIESENLTVSPKSLVEGILSLHNEYSVFSINGYNYYFRKNDFPDYDPVDGLKMLKALSKSGKREAQTVYMFNLFGEHDFKSWVPFRAISLIIEQEIGFTLEDDEYIEIDARFDQDALLIEILENEHKPMALSSILDQFNEKAPDPISSETLKTKLYRLPDVVPLGNTGCYGIASWNNIYAGNIRDLIVEVMDEYNKPISLSTIFNRVIQFFPNTNMRSIESSLKMAQTHYSFTCVGNKFFCSQDDRDKIYYSFVELNSPNEDQRICQLESFLKEYQRFPLRQGCFDEASLRNWLHEVTSGVKTITSANKLKLDAILKNHFNNVKEDSSQLNVSDGYDGQISSFLSGDYDFCQYLDNVLGKKIDITPKVTEYINKICQIPFKDFVSYITSNVLPVEWTTSDITQNSNSEDCHIDLCRALLQQGNPGLDFYSLGKSLLNDGIERNEGAFRKYGENHVKSAAQLGLTYENNGLWYLTEFGKVFCSIDMNLQYNLMARVLLKSPFYANIVSDASIRQINIAKYMEDLSDSTIKRRIPSVKKMLDIIVRACEVDQKIYFNLVNAINENDTSGPKEVSLFEDFPVPAKSDAERIVEYLTIHPNQMARDIATALGMERKDVNTILYTTLSKKVRQDKLYKWSLQ